MSRNIFRHTFLFCVPTVAVLLSYFWFKRKRSAIKSDPGGTADNSNLKDLKNKINIVEENKSRAQTPSVDNKEEGLDELLSCEINKGVECSIKTPSIGEATVVEIDNYPSVTERQLILESSPNSEINISDTDSLVMELSDSVLENFSEDVVRCSNVVLENSSVECSENSLNFYSNSELGKEDIIQNSDASSVVLDDSTSEVCEKFNKSDEYLNNELMAENPNSNIVEVMETIPDLMENITNCVGHLNITNNCSEASREMPSIKDFDVPECCPILDDFHKEVPTGECSREIKTGNSAALPEDMTDNVGEDFSRNVMVVVDKISEDVDGGAAGQIKESQKANGRIGEVPTVRITERDSANHSPADVMLASPSMSHYSDAHSEGSSDSGKGCSYAATPPSRTPASCSSLAGDHPPHSVYEFVLSQQLVGRLIGRHGSFVHQIKAKTHANILIKRHPKTDKLKICAVEGSQMDIEGALEMIREKFPLKRYPNLTLEQVCFLPPVPTVSLLPEHSQLLLVEGVNNDVILSSLISPAHFFLQQPTHPTFPALNQLVACMNMCYSEASAPLLPAIEVGIICAAPAMGGWYRAQVIAVYTELDSCDVKFIDYGGYLTLPTSELRQIRSDFMTLPFQAAECYLAHVIPPGGTNNSWSDEARNYVESLTQGQVLQAQVCGYAEDGMPVVYLFATHGTRVVPIHQELVAQGLAEWWEPSQS